MKVKIAKAIDGFFIPWRMGEGMCVRLTTEEIHTLIMKVVAPTLVKVPRIPSSIAIGEDEEDSETLGFDTYKVYPTPEEVMEVLQELSFEQKLSFDYSSGCSLHWQIQLKEESLVGTTSA